MLDKRIAKNVKLIESKFGFPWKFKLSKLGKRTDV